MQNGSKRNLPFAVRCDGAGEENYADGTPKTLVVRSGGGRGRTRSSAQGDCGQRSAGLSRHALLSGELWQHRKARPLLLLRRATWHGCTAHQRCAAKEIAIGLNETVPLDPDTTVHLAEFIPDFVVQDGHVYARSNDLENPAVHMVVNPRKSGQSVNVWLPRESARHSSRTRLPPTNFDGKDLKTASSPASKFRMNPASGRFGRAWCSWVLAWRLSSMSFTCASGWCRCAMHSGQLHALDRRHREQKQRCLRAAFSQAGRTD